MGVCFMPIFVQKKLTNGYLKLCVRSTRNHCDSCSLLISVENVYDIISDNNRAVDVVAKAILLTFCELYVLVTRTSFHFAHSNFKMSSLYNKDKIFKCEMLSVFTCKDTETVSAKDLRLYIKNNWRNIFYGMKNSTILIIGGVHGSPMGEVGDREDNMDGIKNQVGSSVFLHANT